MQGISGKTLIDMGYRPAKWFREVITTASANGLSEAEVRSMADALAAKEGHTIPLQDGAPLRRFINPENELEAENARLVFESMEVLLRTPTVLSASVMPDACPVGQPGTIPVGGVVSARNAIHPGMHSADVCCSMLDTDLGDVDPAAVLDMAHSLCHFGRGGRRDPLAEVPSEMMRRIADNPFFDRVMGPELAKSHISTIGDGNHFVFVGRSEATGRVHLVTHHGSRGFGAQIFQAGRNTAEIFRRKHAPDVLPVNAWIELSSQDGADYMEGLSIVHDWTILNHRSLHDAVMARLGIHGHDQLFSPHNFVFRDPEDPTIIHHAKGSTPVDPRLLPLRQERMVIPLNMAQPVLIVEPDPENDHGFAPHGAGRLMSRTAFLKANGGLSEAEIVARETRGIDARFFCGTPDMSELPSAYKPADTVLRDMEAFRLARIVDRIHPYGSIMAGDVDRDAPWRQKKT